MYRGSRAGEGLAGQARMSGASEVDGEGAVEESPQSAGRTARVYLYELTQVLDAIDEDGINEVVRVLDEVREKRARVYVIGNGGSAATASHFCNDMSIGLRHRGVQGFDIMSLADNVSVATAIANDLSYEDVFSAQLADQIRPDDVLIAISASGNSPNIIKATQHAQAVGARVIGWTGFDGGQLRRLADVSLHFPTRNGAYGIVEDAHMAVNHILAVHYAGGK